MREQIGERTMTDRAVSLPWRVGRTVGRTIYAQADDDHTDAGLLIGVLDTRGLAAEACASHNATISVQIDSSPQQRARRAFNELCQAVDELSDDDARDFMGDAVSVFVSDWWAAHV
jgi:hypothetical protein